MSESFVEKQPIRSRWTADLLAYVPYVEGTHFEIRNGDLIVTSVLPLWNADLVDQMPQLEGERYELIEGKLFVTSQPHWRHQTTCDNIIIELGIWSRQTGLGRTFQAPGVVYTLSEAVAPDVVWVSKARLEALTTSDGKLHESPELVVEVLSPSTAAVDRKEKLALYDRHDVQEYWIVNWRNRTVDIYRRSDDGLTLAQKLVAGDTLQSPLFPGFACQIDRFFDI